MERTRLIRLPVDELVAEFSSTRDDVENQPACAPSCGSRLLPCCAVDSQGELLCIRAIRTAGFFLVCAVGSMRTFGPWMLSVIELVTMLALFVVSDREAAAHLAPHIKPVGFTEHLADLFTISLVRCLALSVAYGIGLFPSVSFLLYKVTAWAVVLFTAAYLTLKACLFSWATAPPILGVQAAIFALSAAFAVLHLAACHYSSAWHARRRALGLEGLGGPVEGIAQAWQWGISGGPPVPGRASMGGRASTERLREPDSLFVTLRGLVVHYKVASPGGAAGGGEGDGRTAVMLLHGFGGGVFAWRRVMGPLCQATGMPIVAFDRPGFGLTSRPPEPEHSSESPYAPSFHASLALDLAAALGFKRVLLVGHADGALVALQAVAMAQRASAGPPRSSADNSFRRSAAPWPLSRHSGTSEDRSGGPSSFFGSIPSNLRRALGWAVPPPRPPAYQPVPRSHTQPEPMGRTGGRTGGQRRGAHERGASWGGSWGTATGGRHMRRRSDVIGGSAGAAGSRGLACGSSEETGLLGGAEAEEGRGRGARLAPVGAGGGGGILEGDESDEEGAIAAVELSVSSRAASAEGGRSGGWGGGSGVRVAGVALMHPCLLGEGTPQFARMLARSKLGRRLLAPLLRSEVGEVANRRAWFDASKLTSEVLDIYKAPLCIADWDVALTHAVRSLRREASPSLVLSCARSVGPRAPGGGVQMLLIAGAHDRIVAPAQVVNMARSVFVGAEVVVVPECGHMSNEERPDVLTDRLSRFVRSCVSQPA